MSIAPHRRLAGSHQVLTIGVAPYGDIILSTDLCGTARLSLNDKRWLFCVARDIRDIVMGDTAGNAIGCVWLLPTLPLGDQG